MNKAVRQRRRGKSIFIKNLKIFMEPWQVLPIRGTTMSCVTLFGQNLTWVSYTPNSTSPFSPGDYVPDRKGEEGRRCQLQVYCSVCGERTGVRSNWSRHKCQDTVPLFSINQNRKQATKTLPQGPQTEHVHQVLHSYAQKGLVNAQLSLYNRGTCSMG